MSDVAGSPGEAAEARLRALERRLRREKLAVERLNPLEHPDRYATAFARVIDLEAERRDLRVTLDDAPASDQLDDGRA
jgi:hypothetical protein